MSHFPFMLQESLGIAAPEPPSQRVHDLTDETPATFSALLNWDCAENCTAKPTAEDDVMTLMGPAISGADGLGESPATALMRIVRTVRSLGLNCQVIPNEEEFAEYLVNGAPTTEAEAAFLEEYWPEFMPLHAADATGTQASFTVRGDVPWITVRCETDRVLELILRMLAPHFALALLPHRELIFREPLPGYQLTAVTGGNPENIGTLFALRKGPKLIGKALCAYHNSEMDSDGPTLEFIEIAAEWQRHGLGTRMVEAMEEFFCDVFVSAMRRDEVRWSVCYVTTSQASRWFQKRGFRDEDGMGEELSKALGAGSTRTKTP